MNLSYSNGLADASRIFGQSEKKIAEKRSFCVDDMDKLFSSLMKIPDDDEVSSEFLPARPEPSRPPDGGEGALSGAVATECLMPQRPGVPWKTGPALLCAAP